MKRSSRANKKNVFIYSVKQIFTKKIAAIICSLAIICISVFLITGITAQGSSVPRQKLYTSVYIESGDTLWTIAEKYKDSDISTLDYIDEIRNMNGIGDDHIESGNYLVVYYYAD